MIKLDNVTPGFRQNALISINALIDIDVGLFCLIRDEYLDPNVFNVEYFTESSIIDFINTTYFRDQDNPLYSVIKVDKDTADQYYIEFFQNEYNAIYDRSTYTDILPLTKLFLDTKEIDVSILYYKDYSLEQLKKDQAEGKLDKRINFIDAKTLKPKEFNDFKEIYLRSITEFDVLPIKSLTLPKNFYISSFGPNFSKDTGRIKRTDGLNMIMTSKLMHEISIFEMYRSSNLKEKIQKDINDNDESEGEESDYE